YNLDCFVEGAGYTGPIGHHRPAGEWSLSDLIVGSEGTLAVLLEATVRLHPLPKATALCIVHFNDLIESLRAVPTILEHGPSAVELLDRVVIAEAAVNPSTIDKAIALWPEARGREDHPVLPVGPAAMPPHDEAVTQAAELANM